jgi:glycosyltransferase involved in cell wall biosynthesis
MSENKNDIEMPLVSVIMAAYNAEKYITESIQSVLEQTYTNWELVVVNDGSIDKTESKIYAFDDPRIRYFSQINLGVSAARNTALRNIKGNYFCMLDADDLLTPNSLKARIDKMLSAPEAEFVDGTVIVKNSSLDKVLKKFQFSYYGDPTKSLVRLDGNCFFGPSWMIKKIPEKKYLFDESITHGEELMLYLSLSENAVYTTVDEPVLVYRKSDNSAMSNLKGLETGYKKLLEFVKKLNYVNEADKRYMKFRIIRIMFLSYLRRMDILNAFSVFFRFLGQ